MIFLATGFCNAVHLLLCHLRLNMPQWRPATTKPLEGHCGEGRFVTLNLSVDGQVYFRVSCPLYYFFQEMLNHPESSSGQHDDHFIFLANISQPPRLNMNPWREIAEKKNIF